MSQSHVSQGQPRAPHGCSAGPGVRRMGTCDAESGCRRHTRVAYASRALPKAAVQRASLGAISRGACTDGRTRHKSRPTCWPQPQVSARLSAEDCARLDRGDTAAAACDPPCGARSGPASRRTRPLVGPSARGAATAAQARASGGDGGGAGGGGDHVCRGAAAGLVARRSGGGGEGASDGGLGGGEH